MKVPLTTVKSPEEVTGVRSPDPESWTVPLEIGKGLHWMDGKTPGKLHVPFTISFRNDRGVPRELFESGGGIFFKILLIYNYIAQM